MNNRRKFFLALGAGALTSPFASFAQQQGTVWRVGFLATRRRPISSDFDFTEPFTQGMRERGYIEGKNLAVEWRFADDRRDRLPGFAAELVRLNMDVIVVQGTPGITAAQKATTSIPIVMTPTTDPVAAGFVKSLARPGGNITGLANLSEVIFSKHLEVLLSMVLKLSRVAVLVNPTNPNHTTILKTVQAAAQKVGVNILPLESRNPKEIDAAFATMAKEKAGAVIVAADAVFEQQQSHIAGLTAKYRMPSISLRKEFAEAGGLMSYGQNQAEGFRHAATYVDKILKGAKPGDLPVEQPTQFELVINGKTAKTLGLGIPQSLLIMADKVIQ
jgi:putative ABC transport system substrate-binding protein